ncbi:hypothetical protein HNR65_002248 [Desulfosalsimonas propionicica]|uniref:Uncharacterized protein n=1 Tax=Desulfosalsimonas propionicica TaxID=332175 RepID=A0A7W0HL37_9BACT|nr:hypothetical protein [Desulfosalsimonas propionicica]MBA2881914.1 hypothetical protein [Desulfosalsimonas propionicica]
MQQDCNSIHACNSVESLPFVEDTREGRCFWSVYPTGNYEKDYKTGKLYAAFLCDYLRSDPANIYLTWVVWEIIRQGSPKNGIINGFFNFIAEYISMNSITPWQATAHHERQIQRTLKMVSEGA